MPSENVATLLIESSDTVKEARLIIPAEAMKKGDFSTTGDQNHHRSERGEGSSRYQRVCRRCSRFRSSARRCSKCFLVLAP